MTVRNLNFTGRKRIRQHDVTITRIDGSTPDEFSFDAVLNLDPYNLPTDALVAIEAYKSSTRMRFEFGEAGQIEPPPDRRLLDFDTIDGIRFRICIASQDEPYGLLLAVADKLPLEVAGEGEEEREPLLYTRSADIGHAIYRLDYDDVRPTITVNSQLDIDWRSLLKNEAFLSLVYPFAVREVLTNIVIIQDYREGEADDWQMLWLRFAGLLPGIGQVPTDLEDKQAWIDEVVDTFCRDKRLMKTFFRFWDRL